MNTPRTELRFNTVIWIFEKKLIFAVSDLNSGKIENYENFSKKLIFAESHLNSGKIENYENFSYNQKVFN